jgi:hypothetical protein
MEDSIFNCNDSEAGATHISYDRRIPRINFLLVASTRGREHLVHNRAPFRVFARSMALLVLSLRRGIGQFDMNRDIFGRLLRADKLCPAQHGLGQGILRNVVEGVHFR